MRTEGRERDGRLQRAAAGAERGTGGQGVLLIWSQTPRVIARLAAGSVKGKTQHKANEKNVNIVAPVADYGLCLS